MEENVFEIIWNYTFVPIDCEQRKQFIDNIIGTCLTYTNDAYALNTMGAFEAFCNKIGKLPKEAGNQLLTTMNNNLKSMDVAINAAKNNNDKSSTTTYQLLHVSYSYFMKHFINQFEAHKIRKTVFGENQN